MCARWITALLVLGMLGSRSFSAPSPVEEEPWRLLAQRVEAQEFQRFLAEGDAEVQWGNRRVRAQRMEGDLQTGWITATGDVLFSDERGTFRASRMRLNLKTRAGDLYDVQGEVEGIFVTAALLHSDGNTLTMQEVNLTTCDKQPPDFLLSASELSLSTALRLRARRVSLSAWGRRWITVPYLSRRIGRRAPGEPLLPQVGYSRRRGVQLSHGDLLPQRWGQIRYGARVFTRHDPEIQIDLLRRLDNVGDQEPLRRLEPTERSGDSFLETVNTPYWRHSPDARAKQAVFLSLRANSPVENLQRTDLYLRGAELGYQTVASWGGGLLETEWKIGRFRESPTLVTATRTVALVRWQSPTVQIGKQLGADVVLDARASAYTGAEGYSWARALWGVYWDAGERLQAGVGLSLAATSGKSPLASDQLETRREARFRLRWTAKWGVDVLGVWDIEHHRWRDWQIALTPPAHCIQPQLVWSSQQRQLQVYLSLVSR
ncbi:MAG: hypothetical protein KatS3mg023_3282 [Armatimonadota bacterium]|nr:MAG: hypothetical protein KatS3mg023_3282 [Armatimonadota bacterium]